ncbi:phosphoglycerate dehydrogenase [Kiloniella laminariae]|uniref:phosphoglycerate dehydrogenase n=1 Tax=Kiloniella laminariae TaxID=454162 RepID=UPI0003634FA0|nr:phosphoglycerate dehydrogenase [Kiloniella laminariae]
MTKYKADASWNIAVASRSFSRHPILRKELLSLYPNAIFNDEGTSLQDENLISFLSGMDGAIVALEPVTEKIITRLPRLKTISKFGVGFDKIDLNALTKHNIHLGWVGGVNKRSVSELALCMMLSLTRNIDQSSRQIRDGKWQVLPGQLLSNKTIGIIGCGHIGKDLIKILRALGSKILAYDIKDYSEFYKKHNVHALDIDEILLQADIISLHVPLNNTTTNIISKERLAMMKRNAILINTARGGLVDEVALENALRCGQLAGAAFDVFAIEPPENKGLIQLDNFISTPHIGGSAAEAILAMGRAAIEGLVNNQLPQKGIFPQ